MFLNNKYTKLYNKLVSRSSLNSYTEMHHIIPRSLNGGDTKDNIIKLSAREHFICHYLLTKMITKNTPEYFKMIKAFMKMKQESSNQHRYFNSRLFESKRKEFSAAQSFSQQNEKNSQFGTVWVTDLINNTSYKVSKNNIDNIISDTIIKKRTIIFNKPKKDDKLAVRKENVEREAIESFYKFKHGGYRSVRDFCRADYNKSHVYTLRIWKIYILGFNEIVSQGRFLKV